MSSTALAEQTYRPLSEAGDSPEISTRRLMIAISVMMATTMQTLDTTIANVALPSLQGEMSATQDQASWILTSYIIAAAIMTPPTSFLANKFGRKNLFLIAVAAFTAASMLCGMAMNVEQIVLFRLLQGMSGAALIPLSQAVMLDTYPQERQGQAMAMWGMGVMVGPIIGPTLGGWLTEVFNWRWVFFINLPIGIMAFLGIMTFVKSPPEQKAAGFDWYGFSILSLGIAAAQLMFDRGESQDWFASSEIVIEAIIAAICFYLFVIHMLSARNPFMSRDLFRDQNFVIGLIAIFVLSLNMLATMALLPPFLQTMIGYSVIDTGIIMAPRGIGTMIGMMMVGRMIGRFDERIFVSTGLLLLIYALYIMAGFTPDVGTGPIIISGFVQGLGFGLIFVPLSAISFATLPMHLRVEGSAIYSLARNVGSSIGISIAIKELASAAQSSHAVLTENISPYSEPLLKLAETVGATSGDPRTLTILDGMVMKEAVMLSYLHDFWLMMAICAAALPFVLLLRPVDRTQTETAP